MPAPAAIGEGDHGGERAQHPVVIIHRLGCAPGAIVQLVLGQPGQGAAAQFPVNIAETGGPGSVIGSAAHMTWADFIDQFINQVGHEPRPGIVAAKGRT